MIIRDRFRSMAKAVFEFGRLLEGVLLRGAKRFTVSEDFEGYFARRPKRSRFLRDGSKASFSKGQSVLFGLEPSYVVAVAIFER